MTIRLLVAYDGTDFSGFQAQPGPRTVQGELERVLEALCGEPVRVTGSGRTDAGVHALGQVVSFDAPLDAEAVLGGIQGLLPQDVTVVDAARGPDGFHARRSARWRAYTYLIWNDSVRHPVLDRFAAHVRRPVDDPALAEAIAAVVGTHDFRSFARVREDQSPVRTVLEATCEREGPLLRIRIAAESFLHQMVRSIVGTALDVATGRRQAASMAKALLAGDRSAAGPVAPARGLALVDVGYDDAPWPRRSPVPAPWASATDGLGAIANTTRGVR